MKKADKFKWIDEEEEAFIDLKRTLTKPPILAAPKEKEPLYLYVAATKWVLSTVLVVKRMEE